jgi:GNAT superfamily N-acetyltransferase
MELRTATLHDVPALVTLRIQFLKEIAGQKDNPAEDQLASELEKYFITHLSGGDFINWLAIKDGEIVGTGGLCFNNYPPTFKSLNEKRGYIMNIYVLPAYRKQGLAEMIFQKLIATAKQEGVSILTLHATEMGAGLYQKYGFKLTENEMSLML